ncbi:MAG: HAD-IA family hydrolase [Bryobacterales bacterium]
MKVIVFDMDGVLVDPTDSFRRAVIETVRHFTGHETTYARIAAIKNEGGYNDDADVSLRIVRELGFEATRDQVNEVGMRLFWGENRDGFVREERWLPKEGVLERLSEQARLAIFTGRGHTTASHTLGRFCPKIEFDPVMVSDHTFPLKPAPDGLLRILARHPGADAVYVGDTIDDARSARAASLPFIGIAAADAPHRDETIDLFEAEGARAILESVNELEQALEHVYGA